jgi:hypothetical protein
MCQELAIACSCEEFPSEAAKRLFFPDKWPILVRSRTNPRSVYGLRNRVANKAGLGESQVFRLNGVATSPSPSEWLRKTTRTLPLRSPELETRDSDGTPQRLVRTRPTGWGETQSSREELGTPSARLLAGTRGCRYKASLINTSTTVSRTFFGMSKNPSSLAGYRQDDAFRYGFRYLGS